MPEICKYCEYVSRLRNPVVFGVRLCILVNRNCAIFLSGVIPSGHMFPEDPYGFGHGCVRSFAVAPLTHIAFSPHWHTDWIDWQACGCGHASYMSQWHCAKSRLPFLTYNSFKWGLSQPMRQCEEYSHLCERLITFSFSWQHFADGG